MAGSISAAQRLGNTAPKKYRSGDEPIVPTIDRKTFCAHGDVLNHLADWSVEFMLAMVAWHGIPL